MTYQFGKEGYMAIQKQSASGTADAFVGGATAEEIGLPITDDPGIVPKIEKEYKNYYKKSAAEYSDYTVKSLSAEGDFTVPAFTGGPLESVLYGIFGSVTSTQITNETTAYTNVFAMASDIPVWTAAVGRGSQNYQEFYDLRMGSLEIDMKAGDDVMLKVNVTGKGGSIANSAFTPNYTTKRSFIFDDLGVSIGGSPNCDVSDLTLKIDRGLKSTRTMCASAAKGDNMFYTTTIKVEGSFTMYFQNYDEYKYWLGGSSVTAPTFDQNASTTKRAMVITGSGEAIGDGSPADNAALILTLPAVTYDTAEITMPFDDRMEVKFNFKALYDPTTELAVAGTGTIKAQVDSDFNAQSVLV